MDTRTDRPGFYGAEYPHPHDRANRRAQTQRALDDAQQRAERTRVAWESSLRGAHVSVDTRTAARAEYDDARAAFNDALADWKSARA